MSYESSTSPYSNFVRSVIIPKYTVKKLEDLIESTKVGDYICFKAVTTDEFGHRKVEKVKGNVREKYPHIFKLSNGKYYQWKDLLIGR